MAATLPVVHRLIKGIGAFCRNKFFEQGGIGVISLYMCVVFFVGAVPYRIGFGKQAPGVEGKYADGDLIGKYFMRYHLVFIAEAGREGNPAGKLAYECVYGIGYL